MKKLNKKGFTLVELLAVIAVLALIMVFAIPAVLDASSSATKNTFRLYGQRVLEKTQEYVESEKISKSISEIISTDNCITLDELGLTNAGNYKGAVKLESYTNGKGVLDVQYTLYLSDGNLMYNGVNSSVVYSKDDSGALSTWNSAAANTITDCGGPIQEPGEGPIL